ncbi:ATP-binding protein [Streptomyces sp. NPDC048182]|uniref:ATP-binding protein n=1 Tax=Streptomyces sp. NPDC048182 TaxID=3365507 RepID=UPI003717C698
MSASFHVPPSRGAVSVARRHVVALVRDWRLPLAEDTVETLELLASEVITNAVLHTSGCCHVTVAWDGNHVRLEAEDTGAGHPARRVPGPGHASGEGGRGLHLVDALACTWGSRPSTVGKVVWFEVGDRSSADNTRPDIDTRERAESGPVRPARSHRPRSAGGTARSGPPLRIR